MKPPLDMEILSRKKVGHYWLVRGVVNGRVQEYRMPAHYMDGSDAEQETAMKDGLEIIADHEEGRR